MIPEHIGFIMDGNRRWAKRNNLAPELGHNRGAEVFKDVCKWCIQNGVKYVTAYAFSTENWKRTEEEKKHIFGLLQIFFQRELDNLIKNGLRIKIIGERTHFDARTLAIIEEIEAKSAACDKLFVQIALSYGGRDEITRAATRLAADVASGTQNLADITENTFASYLDTAGAPDVDLVIRTGGTENQRLSNFLPWQTAYAELYFSALLWPDFSEAEFQNALAYFAATKRNAGK
ncbi:MAG: di-trans,poly-cis-decaprenylcistransferase [Candidatus Nomurabacteria bacterium]|jgi:undecaprenyl diphosphate synthase|nr:di-trans,poly-cis-decaprenylcistransferase [Candidatus Nomurabacteria bacterium]